MGQCFTASRDQIADLERELSTRREDILRLTERQDSMERDHLNQIAKIKGTLCEEREETRRLTELLSAMEKNYNNQVTELKRELSEQTEEVEILTRQQSAMERDYLPQISEKTRELSEKREEVRRLTERMNAMGRDYSSQLSEKTRELSEKREEVRRLTERMNAMERDYSSQLSEKTRELTLKEEEITRLTEQSRGSEHLDQANNLQQRDRDWVINRDEVQIRRDQNLGEGAWGTVYRGKFRGCDVAVKETHSNIMSDRNLQSFLREAEMASRCRHPCLLQFIGATTDERPLVITEIMKCSLRARLYDTRKTPLSEQKITIISLDVAKALNYLHQKPRPIIHHDISSSNVLLWRQGGQWRAKVSDYGTANFVRQSNINYAGAANYCAPEFLHPDPRKPISCQVSTSTGVQNKLLVKSACL